jgi:hypothetical protein
MNKIELLQEMDTGHIDYFMILFIVSTQCIFFITYLVVD